MLAWQTIQLPTLVAELRAHVKKQEIGKFFGKSCASNHLKEAPIRNQKGIMYTTEVSGYLSAPISPIPYPKQQLGNAYIDTRAVGLPLTPQ